MYTCIKMYTRVNIIITMVVLAGQPNQIESQKLVERTSLMDSFVSRFMYRSLRNLTLMAVGRTGWRTAGPFLQKPFGENLDFPCDVSIGRSADVPTSIQKLRPGDINVIGAIGDSLTAASGANSRSLTEIYVENRGLAWSIGGQWNWRNTTTLPNIIKMYNPNLIGYSLDDSFPFHHASQFNLAQIAAISDDIPYMARRLVNRIQSDRRVNFKKDWKMVTILIGGNDLCSLACLSNKPDSISRKHQRNLITTLRYIRDNMPRTFVNIVSAPPLDTIVLLAIKPERCSRVQHIECSCWVGQLNNQSDVKREKLKRIQQEFIQTEEDVAHMNEFRNLKEFAVVYQPFTKNFSILAKDGEADLSLFAYDCFHMSQKGNSWAGTSLWNNLLQPTPKKQHNWSSPHKRFMCPTSEHPYIFTYDNEN